MPADFVPHPVRGGILPARGLDRRTRRPGSPHSRPSGAGVAPSDPTPSRSAVSPVRRLRAGQPSGKLGRREKAREEKRCRPGVEGMDPRLLMAAGPHLTTAQIAARIGPTVQQLMAQDHIAGMGVSVTYRGRVRLAKGYGLADVAAGAPVTATTRFEIGSTTKIFTTDAILLLVQKPKLIKEHGIRRLNLDAPISNYLRDRGGFHLPATWANLTTRQLLNMSAGMPDAETDYQIPWYDVINASAPNNLEFPPGTQYDYSNMGFWLMGEMIPQLTGRTYEQFVTGHVLRPLGMTHTSFIGPEPLLPGQAAGYEFVNGQFVQPSPYSAGDLAYAAGAIVSTPRDMAKCLVGLQTREILSPAMYRMMWTPTPLPLYGRSPTVIATPGLGWDDVDSIHTDPRAGRVVGKSGASYGYAAQVSLFQSQGYGITVLCNSLTFNSAGRPSPLPEDVVNAIDAAIVGNSRTR